MTTADTKDKVLEALGRGAIGLRRKLGEPPASLQKFNVPLEQAATCSLEALQAYSLARKAYREKNHSAALSYDQQAVRLDSNFALAYVALGDDYYNVGDIAHADEAYTRAFQLQDRATDRDQLAIAASYYMNVTGELDQAPRPTRK